MSAWPRRPARRLSAHGQRPRRGADHRRRPTPPRRRRASSATTATADERGPAARIRDEFEALQDATGYRFRDRGLLEHALTHRSRANEDVTGGVIDNESLEFLGDAVLGFVVADLLFRGSRIATKGRSRR